MDVETDPPQPDPVRDAIRDVLAAAEPVPDPWWQAGIDESSGE